MATNNNNNNNNNNNDNDNNNNFALLEIEPAQMDVSNSSNSSNATALAMEAILVARKLKVLADLEQAKLANPCESSEAVDYSPRGKKCIRVLIDGVSCLELTIVSSQVGEP